MFFLWKIGRWFHYHAVGKQEEELLEGFTTSARRRNQKDARHAIGRERAENQSREKDSGKN